MPSFFVYIKRVKGICPMLVQLNFPSKSGKSIQKAVYEFADCRSLETAIACLKSVGAKKANKSTTTFEVIESYDKAIFRWDSERNKFVHERAIIKRSYVKMKKAQYREEKMNKIDAKIGEFFDTIEEFILLHKPMCQSLKLSTIG